MEVVGPQEVPAPAPLLQPVDADQQVEPVVGVVDGQQPAPGVLPLPYRKIHELRKEKSYPDLRGLQNKEVIEFLLKYLGPNDFKPCRMICHNWNMAVLFHSDRAQRGFSGRIRDKWYSQADTLDLDATFAWNTLELYHFSYRRRAPLFQTYWTNSASELKILNMNRCSLECDGFIFLLDRCPALETLTMKLCKFRDLDDFHNDCRIIAKRRRLMPDPPVPVLPITHQIRHLSFESMTKIEHCFMDYLVRRTGHLESISVCKCFLVPPKRDAPVDPKHRERFSEFERNLLILLNHNVATLRKYEIKENNYQDDFFGHLADLPSLTIPEFSLGLLHDDSGNYTNIIRFMNNVRGLEKLTLEFKGGITSTPLDNMLRGHRFTLQKLKLLIPGNKCGGRFTALNLNILQTFTALDSLEVEDSKELEELKIRPFIGGKRAERKPKNNRPKPKVDVATLLKSAQTNLESNFLGLLPNTLRKLTLNKFMASINYLEAWRANPNTFASFRGLTKLEVYGPWIYPITQIVQTISTELLALESLALNNCGVSDEDMTDLSTTSVVEMQHSLTYGLALFSPDNSPSRQEIEAAVQRGMRQNLGIPRRRLSDLPNLKHLDLTRGLRLSDVTLFDALRMPELKTLILDCCYRITDSGLEFLCMNCPNIEELSLKHCRRLSRLGLNRTVTRCRRLKKLFTTKIIQNDALPAFDVPLNPNFGDIVSIDTSPQTEGFQDED